MDGRDTPGPASGASSRSPLLAAACACALVAGVVAAKATRDSLFLTTFPATTLPRVMTASAIASVLAVLLMSRLMARFSPRRVLTLALALAFVLVLAEWGLTFAMPRVAAVAVYLHVAFFGATLLSAFWSMMNERFDPYTAKKVMGPIGVGATVGGVLGGGMAYLAARALPLPSMLLSVAVLDLLALLLLRRLAYKKRDIPAEVTGPSREATAPVQLLPALRILREGSYLRHLAWLVALSALVESLLDYTFNAQAAASLQGASLASFFAAYQAGVSVLGFVAQSLLARTALDSLGLAGTVGLRPLTVAVSSLAALFDPRLLSLLFARGAHAVLTASLFRSAYELLFTPVPTDRKRPTKAIIDVGFDKVGSVAGGLVALVVVSLLPGEAARILLGVCVVVALLSLLVTSWLHDGYIGALEQSLRSGAVNLEPDEVKDATTRFFYTRATGELSLTGTMLQGSGVADNPLLAAIADLQSGQRSRILRALPVGRDPDPLLVPFLIPLLARDTVLAEVVKTLRRVAEASTGQLADALLDPKREAVVRRRIPRVLVAAPTSRTVEALLRGLEDERFDVRARCALGLSRILERNPALKVGREVAFDAARAELKREGPVRDRQKSGDTGSHDEVVEHVFTLLSLVLEREPMQIASRAVKSEERALVGTALEYLETVLPEDLRRALWQRMHVGVRDRTVVRASHEVLDELLRSSHALRSPRRGLGRKVQGEKG
jgi:ATP:ADP antiporter, AAA family